MEIRRACRLSRTAATRYTAGRPGAPRCDRGRPRLSAGGRGRGDRSRRGTV